MFPLNKHVFISTSKDIIYNLTIEELLFKTHFKHPILFLYQNSKCVVIGKHQNPYKECNLDYMRHSDITLSRRTSGGGAVYQDMGNLCFSFMDSHIPQVDFKATNSNILISSMNRLGLKAVFNGRNDILSSNRKISGSAFRLDFENSIKPRYLHHGTLLFNVDLAMMNNSLHPHKLKLISNSVNSIRSRVINIKSIIPSLTVNGLKESIANEFFRAKGLHNTLNDSPFYLPNESSSAIKNNELIAKYRYYQSWKWKYGETPQFTHSLIHKFPFGLIDLSFQVSKGEIGNINVYSDSNETMFIDRLANEISKVVKSSRKTIDYNKQGLTSIFDSLAKAMSISQEYTKHLLEMKTIFTQRI